MKIKILGPGCAKCQKTYDLVNETLAEIGKEADVEKVTGMMEIAAYGVMGTPAVVVDEQVKCVGKIPSKGDITSWING